MKRTGEIFLKLLYSSNSSFIARLNPLWSRSLSGLSSSSGSQPNQIIVRGGRNTEAGTTGSCPLSWSFLDLTPCCQSEKKNNDDH